MSNTINIEAARAALARAAWVRGQAPTYGEDAVSDLIADIRHLCTAAGHDFERCSRVATMYFNDECGGAA